MSASKWSIYNLTSRTIKLAGPLFACTFLFSGLHDAQAISPKSSEQTFTRFAQNKTTKTPGAPARFETIIYKGWRVSCQSGAKATNSKKSRCSAVRQLKDVKSGRLIFGWVLGLNAKKQLVSVIQIPTGGVKFTKIGAVRAISVIKGVKVKVGKTEQTFQYGACTVGICEATGILGRKLQRVLNKPGSVAVTFYTNQGKDINFNFKDDGIEKAIAAVLRQ